MLIYLPHCPVFLLVSLLQLKLVSKFLCKNYLDSIRSPTDRDAQFFDLNDLNRPTQSSSQSGNYNRSRITQKPNLI
jgi:hypothetical protein